MDRQHSAVASFFEGSSSDLLVLLLALGRSEQTSVPFGSGCKAASAVRDISFSGFGCSG
jgi:hypothetical protein